MTSSLPLCLTHTNPPQHLSRSRSRQARTSGADSRDHISSASSLCVWDNLIHNGGESLSELPTELLGFFQTTRDGVGAESTKAVIGVAGLWLALGLGGHLDDEGTTVKGVDEDEAGFEVGVRGPGSVVVYEAAAGEIVVFGVDVEVGDFADGGSRWVLGDRGDIVDTDTSCVVGF